MAIVNSDQFDFIIVGSGSAGSVMAKRLSEDLKNTVLVLEFGGSDRGPLIQMPSALSYPMSMKLYNWGFESEPEPHLNNRKLVTPRGKVMGGSSSINGMVYVRGHAKDFDTWRDMGASGWSYADVLPYFKRMENVEGGEKGWRGTEGPMFVKRGRMNNPLYQAFIDAGVQAGYPHTVDYNGHQQEGFGAFEMTVHDGLRWSAANAYLKPALKNGKVKLQTGARVRKILLEGKKAVGAYWASALHLNPALHFELDTTLLGADSITLYYRGLVVWRLRSSSSVPTGRWSQPLYTMLNRVFPSLDYS